MIERERLSRSEVNSNSRVVRVSPDLMVERFEAVRKEQVGEDLPEDEKAKIRAHHEALIQEYAALELTLPVDDEPARGLCQVLTNNGFETVSSCDGHGEKLPHIFFTCPSQKRLKEITHLVARGATATRFAWQIRLWAGDPGLNPKSPLFFVLEPDQAGGLINPADAKEELHCDMDIIALASLEHFKEIAAKK